MPVITVESQIDPERRRMLGIENWPMWEKGVSVFSWQYDDTETCYLLAGEVEVIPEGGEPVLICKGDLAVFPRGMCCVWKITQPLVKHYTFD